MGHPLTTLIIGVVAESMVNGECSFRKGFKGMKDEQKAKEVCENLDKNCPKCVEDKYCKYIPDKQGKYIFCQIFIYQNLIFVLGPIYVLGIFNVNLNVIVVYNAVNNLIKSFESLIGITPLIILPDSNVNVNALDLVVFSFDQKD